ncbi:hypothetical protein H0H93_012454 [Arthromyces matolae]|nr:hypothetical protein H0H93_012454 [Arthromyces matolae]
MRFTNVVRTLQRHVHSATNRGTINPDEIAHFSRLSSQWWDEQGEFQLLHRMNPVRVQFIREKLEEVALREHEGEEAPPPKGLRSLDVLDVGCGGGLLSESLARLGANTLGIDASESNIKIAQLHASADPKLASLSYRHTAAESLLESSKRYDVVCSMEVLEHVDHPATFLSTCAELVKPGGHLFLSTISRTPLAWFLTIFLAEDVFRKVSRGTHTYSKFIKPTELVSFFQKYRSPLTDPLYLEHATLPKAWISPHASPESPPLTEAEGAIQPIDKTSVHRITSGQVVIDLQTAVKELVENSLDAGATTIEVRFKQNGLKAIEVIDNGSGIPEQYHDNVALKHYTSKLSQFSDLTTVRTFGFRGEALSSLCALSESFSVNTATESPMGVSLEMDFSGKVAKRSKIARQRGTTVIITNLFKPLPVRRKEFEKNVKREYAKALGLLNAYALIGTGIRLSASNVGDKSQKTVQLHTSGASNSRALVAELWGSKALEHIVDLDLKFEVERDKTSLKRISGLDGSMDPITVSVKGLISKFAVGGGRAGTDRQFFYVNGRPYSCDINVSPDKRTIFLSSENNIVAKLKTCLEEAFAPSRSTYDVGTPNIQRPMTQTTLPLRPSTQKRTRSQSQSRDDVSEDEGAHTDEPKPSKRRISRQSPSLEANPTSRRKHSSPVRSPSSSSPQTHIPSLSSESSSHTQETSSPHPIPDHALSPPAEQGLGEELSPSFQQQPSPRDQSMDPYQPPAQADTHQNDEMDVDGDHQDSPLPSRRNSIVVLDTSSTVWSHVTASQATDKSQLPDKKGAKEVQLLSTTSQAPVSKVSTDKQDGISKSSATRREAIRSRLLGFARIGSQIPVAQSEEGEEEEEEEEDDDEEGVQVSEERREQNEDSQSGSTFIPDNAGDEDGEALPVSPRTKPHTPPAESMSEIDLTHSPSSPNLDLTVDVLQSPSKTIDLTLSDDDFDDSQITRIVDETSSVIQDQAAVSRPEVIRTGSDNGDITLRFSVEKIARAWRGRADENVLGHEMEMTPVPSAAGVSNTDNNDSATTALARIIDKKDFATMDIVGQFNLGFIIARRRQLPYEEGATSAMDDLFIVDQHAADEKYNFETLQQTTTIKSQKLFKPQRIELTAADELVALENIHMLRQNGFEVEEIDEEDAVRPGARLQLSAQPVSKSTVFDMKGMFCWS